MYITGPKTKVQIERGGSELNARSYCQLQLTLGLGLQHRLKHRLKLGSNKLSNKLPGNLSSLCVTSTFSEYSINPSNFVVLAKHY